MINESDLKCRLNNLMKKENGREFFKFDNRHFALTKLDNYKSIFITEIKNDATFAKVAYSGIESMLETIKQHLDKINGKNDEDVKSLSFKRKDIPKWNYALKPGDHELSYFAARDAFNSKRSTEEEKTIAYRKLKRIEKLYSEPDDLGEI